MKKMIYLGLLLIGYQSFSAMAQCGPSNNIIQDSFNSALNLNIGFPAGIGQSFTASCSGNIEAITVKHSFTVVDGDIMLTLYDGVNPTNPLDSVIVSISAQNAMADLLITFSTPVVLTSGNEYSFILKDLSGHSGFMVIDTNSYVNGAAQYYEFGSSIFENFFDYVDLYFEVHYEGVPDAAVSQTNTLKYTVTPLTQVTAIGTEGAISNVGSGALTNVSLQVEILDDGGNAVYSASSSEIPSLAAGASLNFNVPGFVPTSVGNYTVNLTASFLQLDAISLNDLSSYVVSVSDSIYSRDDNMATGSLSIGSGNTGQIGQAFEIVQADELTSLSFFIENLTGNMAGHDLSGGVYATDATGTPTTLIASTTTITLDSTMNTFWTLPILNGAVLLTPGTYVFVVNEAGYNVSLGFSSGNFHPETGWVNWPTNPFGGWANSEDFGYEKTFFLRANFRNCTDVDASVSDVANVITAAQVGGTYQWIDCSTGLAIAGANQQIFMPAVNGSYAVLVGSDNCFATSNCTTISTIGLTEYELNKRLEVFPNPSNGIFQVRLNTDFTSNLKIEIMDATGKVVNSSVHNSNGIRGVLEINATGLETGIYLLKVSSSDAQWTKQIVVNNQ